MAKDSGPSILTLALLAGAAYVAYEFFFSSSSTSTAAAQSPAGSAVSTTAAATQAPAAPAGPTLASLFSQTMAAATADAKAGDTSNQLALVNGQPQTTFSAWNYFLVQQDPSLTGLPDYTGATGNANPGPVMTGSQYWAIMAPWLTKNKGLSGAARGLAGLTRMGVR